MIGTLRAVVLDAADERRLAAFYSALGGWTELTAEDDFIALQTGDGWRVATQRRVGVGPSSYRTAGGSLKAGSLKVRVSITRSDRLPPAPLPAPRSSRAGCAHP